MQKAASERGRRMAGARWARERARRERLASLRPEDYPREIVRRILVIDREREVREAVIWSWDSAREARRKIKRVLQAGVDG